MSKQKLGLAESFAALRLEIAISMWDLIRPVMLCLMVIEETEREQIVREIVLNTKRAVDAQRELDKLRARIREIDTEDGA